MEHDHKNYVTYASLVNYLIAGISAAVSIAFLAGASHFRIGSTQEKVLSMEVQAHQATRELQALRNDLVQIKNDQAWNNEYLRLIAEKLEISIPKFK